MALSRELPYTFFEAIRFVKQTLSQNRRLVAQNLVETESEQIVLAAYRKATGLELRRVELFAKSAEPFPAQAAQAAFLMSAKRAAGELLQHQTGVQGFLDHLYVVSPQVLVPRPETEVLAVQAFGVLDRSKPGLGIEVGLGSGILSIELLSRFPELKMEASEISEGARKVAELNAQRLLGGVGANRLKIHSVSDRSQVLGAFRGLEKKSADFIISNPPYLILSDPIDEEVKLHEPHEALFAPAADPLYFYREIAKGGATFLKQNGVAFLELPSQRTKEIVDLFLKHGWSCMLHDDLTEQPRVLVARLGEQSG